MDDRAIIGAIAREIQTGAIVLDKEKKVLYANPFFLKSFPFKGEVTGRPTGEILGDPSLISAIDAFVEMGVSPVEFIEIREAGRDLSVRLVPLDGGRLLIFLRDITEEKRVEAIKKDFVANVSHELRTPLASIKGYSETLLDGGMDEPDTLQDFLRIIDKHATRMSRLIDDLLTLSRLESEHMSIEYGRLDIRELVSSLVHGLEKQADDKGTTLTLVLSDEVPNVLGDRDRLEQVVVNLLDNAIKYTPPGGSVTVSVFSEGDEVRVNVSDTGMGVPTKDIPRIFERFYRVDKARSRDLGGTGLGLAIAKHIIQGHGGRLWVESEQGKGSIFSFTIKTAA